MSVCIAGIIIHCLTKQYNPPVFIGNMLYVCITYTESEKKMWRARLITTDSKLKTNSLRDLNIVMYIIKSCKIMRSISSNVVYCYHITIFPAQLFLKIEEKKETHIQKKEHVSLYKLYFYNIQQCIKIKEMFKFKSSNIRI